HPGRTRHAPPAAREPPRGRLLLRPDEADRGLGGGAELPGLRPLHPPSPLDRRRAARPRETGLLARRRGIRPRDRRLRGLGLLPERPGAGVARASDPPGDARVPKARALGERGAPAPLPARLPPAAGQARRPLRAAQGVRGRDRPWASRTLRLSHLLGVASDPGAGREGPLLEGAFPPPGAGELSRSQAVLFIPVPSRLARPIVVSAGALSVQLM